MQLDLERVHNPKYGRRQGATVNALLDAMGKIMVTQNAVIPFVVKYMDRVVHKRKDFIQLCKDHFNEEPVFINNFNWGIKGYSSFIKFISIDMADEKLRGYFIEPTYDLD